ncbi:replication-associated protein [Crucivirus-349]|nr:replication-associated protein [Crucivirus-349]
MSIRKTIITSYLFQEREFEANLKTKEFAQVKFAVIQEELCPKTNKMHHQGYLEFNKPVTLAFIKKLTGDNTTHVVTQKMKGTPLQGAEYCGYNNGGETEKNKEKAIERIKNNWYYFEHGKLEWQEQGKRNDINEVVDMIHEGKQLKEIVEEYTSTYIRNYKGIERAMQIMGKPLTTPKIEEKQVFLNYGESGTGKTELIYNSHPIHEIFRKPPGQWWDGYCGQKYILIDDIQPNEYKIEEFLQWLDKYPISVPIKGSFVPLTCTHIYLTSNFDPNKWFNYKSIESYKAIIRRITKIKYHEKEPLYDILKREMETEWVWEVAQGTAV